MISDFYSWDSFLKKEQIKKINTTINKNKIESIDKPAPNTIKTSKVEFVNWNIIKNDLNNIYEDIKWANTEFFGYNLYEFGKNDQVLYNEYNSKNQGEYAWHTDMSGNHIYDIKFTAIINISTEKYEGGNFEIFAGQPSHIKILDNPGSVFLFKSYLLHRVTPVLSGVRKSIAMFLIGPRFI